MTDIAKDNNNKQNQNNTFYYEGKLPKVPLVNLEDTIKNFKKWCLPLLNKEERKKTFASADYFARKSGLGEKLHEKLSQYDNRVDTFSWLDDFWKTRYLGRRCSVSINANFVFSFINNGRSQTKEASILIYKSLVYKRLLDQEQISPALLRGKPLCMSQSRYLFSTTRVPKQNIDSVISPYSKELPGPSPHKHILVSHNSRFFKLYVLDGQNIPYDPETIEKSLKSIISNSQENIPEGERFGYLTTMPREEWAKNYNEIIGLNKENKKTMEDIQNSLFSVSLDNSTPEIKGEVVDLLLHGDGGTRWFDKSISLIVFKNGQSGINCEHCGLDGTMVVDFVNFIRDDNNLKIVKKVPFNKNPDCSDINLTLNKNINNKIIDAKSKFDDHVKSLMTEHLSHNKFGSDTIKTFGVSPDSFVQLALQLAFYKKRGFLGTTYESISTRQFEHGRTEAMRVVTPQMLNFVKTVESNDSISSKKEAIKNAASAHIERIKECQSGNAPEQHLWQLEIISKKNSDIKIIDKDLELFSSAGWRNMRDDYISTTSVGSKFVNMIGFMTSSKKCIGVAYSINRSNIEIYISGFKDSQYKPNEFSNNLRESIDDMVDILKNV